MIRFSAFRIRIKQGTAEHHCLIALGAALIDDCFDCGPAGVIACLATRFSYAAMKEQFSFSVIKRDLARYVSIKPIGFQSVIVDQHADAGNRRGTAPQIGALPVGGRGLWLNEQDISIQSSGRMSQ